MATRIYDCVRTIGCGRCIGIHTERARPFIYSCAYAKDMFRPSVTILSAIAGVLLMICGYAGYLKTDGDMFITLFVIGLAAIVASYLSAWLSMKRADAENACIREEESLEGYVYYMSDEPHEMEATITYLERR